MTGDDGWPGVSGGAKCCLGKVVITGGDSRAMEDWLAGDDW